MLTKELKKIFEGINCFYGKTSENIFKTLFVNKDFMFAKNQYSQIVIVNNVFKTEHCFSIDIEQTLNLIKVFGKMDIITNSVNKSDSTITFSSENIKITQKVDFASFDEEKIKYSDSDFICSVLGKDLVKTMDYASSICNLEEFDNLFIVNKKMSAISTFYSLILNSSCECLSTNNQKTLFSLKYEFVRHFIKICSVMQTEQSIFSVYKTDNSIIFVIKSIDNTDSFVVSSNLISNEYSDKLNVIKSSIENKLKKIECIAEFSTDGFNYMCGKIFKATKGIDRGTNLVISNKKIFIKVQNEDAEVLMQDVYVDSIHYTKKFENFYLNQPYNNSAFYKFIRSYKDKTINLFVFEEDFVNYYVFGNVVDNITIFQK